MSGGHFFARELAVSPELLVLREIAERLGTLPNALRQQLADRLWESIPVTTAELANNDNLAAGGTLPVVPQTSNLERITAVIACVPGGTTGVLQLGSWKIYLGPGVFISPPLSLVLNFTDTRALTLGAAGGGPASLGLFGEQLPAFGKLSG